MKKIRNSGAEAISDLPANVIDNILACLPLRDAVRTSLLSKEWRYKWISIPELVFDFRFDRSYLRNHKFERIIYQVLLHHQGAVNKFSLQVPTCRSSPDIDQWILFLSNCKVEDFTLHIYWGSKHGMPSHFFSFQHLTHLNLYKCVFYPPKTFKGFSKLVTLDFQKVDFVPAVFKQFISQCLLLERVRLIDCTDWDSTEIEGPSLRFFTFHGVFRSIRFKNCSVLGEVSLSIPLYVDGGIQSTISKKYFDFLPTLEKVNLHPGLLKCLGAGGAPSQFPSSLNRLRALNLSLYLDSMEEITFALCLVRSSPNLHMLRITFYASEIVEAVVEFIRAQETPDFRMSQLKRVVIAVFSSTEPQMEFVKYILAVAAALEVMVVSPSKSSAVSGVGELSLINQLKQLPRASPNAQICVR
ncbi:hypothetical protein ACJIZ3_017492 [Penstemon smallii]|uniref:F-box domain-containing protein n=1 Tax=Penstemon smallii TaxID=265156 RepID=A0ABD3SW58_9LAMI